MIPISKPILGEEEKEEVIKVLNSGMLAQGEQVKELEEKYAKFCGTKYAIATNNGTSALHTALYSMGIKPGDEVITVPFTFVASANCILMQGAKPIFVDIEDKTFMIDPEKIRSAITPKTKAILPVDLYGQVYDAKALREIAEEHNLVILEDACQAVGAELGGKRAGSFGDTAAFSFYATKNMMTGEGGIITTDNEECMELAKQFRHHGQSEKTRYEYHDLGYNYRMMNLQAAIGLAQLRKIDGFTQKRIENAKMLTEGLKDVKGIEVPYIKPGARHVFHQYTIKVDPEKREQLFERLKKNDIGYGVYYPKPLHLHPFFMDMGYKQGDFPVSEDMSKCVVSLPVHPSLTADDVNKIIETVKQCFN